MFISLALTHHTSHVTVEDYEPNIYHEKASLNPYICRIIGLLFDPCLGKQIIARLPWAVAEVLSLHNVT